MLLKRNVGEDLKNAHLDANFIDSAVVEFISYVMNSRGFNGKRTCSKDPDIVKDLEYIHRLLPKSKFIFMVRDGRAAVYSLMVQVKESFKKNRQKRYLSAWNQFNRDVSGQCSRLGATVCLLVKYEDLVMHPESTLKREISFLNETWSGKLLSHQNFIGRDIIVSKTEWSSHQIVNN